MYRGYADTKLQMSEMWEMNYTRCLLQGVDQLGYLKDLAPDIEKFEAAHPSRITTTIAN